jgi:glutamyl-tRNA(Gln) amidotransferase subunit E
LFTPPLDYAAVGLKVGLEVHQQLLTEHKMFCRCPAGRYTHEHDGTVLRHMRPTLSELGEYDGTALMEFKTKKNIIYLLHKDNTCTYEMDDTPPFLVNQQALDIAIEQCLMLGCDIIDEVHIARKQYLDGSIPTGFQRTAIVGVNGKLPFRGRELSVIQVSMEEDSCREVSDRGHLVIWRTDRLGMPLIETVTGPDLHTPEEVAEAILLVGRVCRSTRHVRVGPGASRQDVNVSVTGGRRVEIKGVSYAWLAPLLVHNEAWRQVNLLKLRDEMHRRGFTQPEDIQLETGDVTRIFTHSNYEQVRRDAWERYTAAENRRPHYELGEGKFQVLAVKLPGMAGLLAHPTQPYRFFASELKGRVRVIAGLDQQPILLHSDKWPDYDSAQQELSKVRKQLKCKAEDAVVVVWGPEQDTHTAAQEIRLRLVDAIDGIPHETRQPLPDGNSDFERILPGADRMYPDTDSPPTRVTRDRVERLHSGLPRPPWVREAEYSAAGVPEPVVRFLIRRGGADLVDKLTAATKTSLKRLCFFVGEELKGLQRKCVEVREIEEARWVEFFGEVENNELIWEVRRELVERMARRPEQPLRLHLEELGIGEKPRSWQTGLAKQALAEYQPRRTDSRERRQRYACGRALRWLRGRVSIHDVVHAVIEQV